MKISSIFNEDIENQKYIQNSILEDYKEELINYFYYDDNYEDEETGEIIYYSKSEIETMAREINGREIKQLERTISNIENAIEMINKFEECLKIVEDYENLELIHFNETSGGDDGRGYSFLIEAEYNEERFILCKLSDHSKYNHQIQLYDYMSVEEMASKLSEEEIQEVIENEI